MTKKTKKQPKLRFSEFADDWEQRKFSEGVSEIGDGLHGTPTYCEAGNVYFINGNNLVDGKIAISAETKKVNESQQSTADKSLDDTTILMSINGTIGNLAYYSGERLMLGKSAAYIKVSEFDKRFVYAYLQAPSARRYFMDSLTGTTIKNLGLKAIREMIMCIPQDANEQKRIGKFFDYLDHLIAFRQRELDELKELKQGMLQKMFPKNGADVPEIRFPEFTDAWEQRKLGDITEFVTGKSFSSELLDDGSYTVMDMGAVSQEGHRIETKRTNTYRDMLRKDDLIMPKDDIGGGLIIGRTAYIPCDNKFVLGDHVYRLRFSNENGLFVHYQINSHGFRKQILPLVTGSAQLGLNSKSIQGVYIRIPSYSEQVKIGSYFQNLDNLIALQQKELDGYKELKKGLLQQMFC